MWLGIPPTDQPPNLYRLLGVGLFESDADVISNAADRQMVHVRTFQGGKYSALSQRVLNELSSARVCLLDPKKKAEYDDQLRKQMAAKVAALRPVAISPAGLPPVVAAAAPTPAPAVVPGPAAVPLAGAAPAVSSPAPPVQPPPADAAVFVPKPVRSVAAAAPVKERSTAWQVPAMVGALGVLALVVAIFWLSQSGGTDTRPSTPSSEENKADVASHSNPPPAPAPASGAKKPAETAAAAKPKTPQAADSSSIPGVTGPDVALTVQPETMANDAVGEIRSFPKQKGAVRAVCFSPSGAVVASGGADGKVWLWNVERAKEIRHFDEPGQPVAAIAFSADGQLLAAVTGPAEGDPKGHQPGEPSKLYVWKVGGGPPVVSAVLDPSFSATDVKFSPQKLLLALAGRDGIVRLYDPVDKREIETMKKHSGPVWSVAFSPDGKMLASGGEDHSVWLWSVDPANPVREFTGHRGPVTAVTFTSDGRQVASGSKDKSVLIWSPEKDKPDSRFEGLESAITCLASSAGGQCVVAGDEGGALRLFQPVKGRLLDRFSGHEGAVLHVDGSLLGRRVVSAGADGTVRLWGLPDPLSTAAEAPKTPLVKTAAAPKKPAVPSEAACKKAEEALKAGPLKDDFESADRPSLRAALARKLIDQGNAARDPLGAYAALDLALELGKELGDTEVAFAAIDGMGRKFDLDPVATKVDVLEAMLKARAVAVAANRGPWIEKILALVQEALEAEKPDPAARLLLIVRPMSKAARDSAALGKRIQTLAKQVAEAQQLQAEIREARQRLATQPDDPEANQRMGTYLCFLKGNWEEGLPPLAKSAEPGLKLLAQNELTNTTFVDQQFGLANDWWTLAGTQKGKARLQIRLHASHWYKVAEPNLTGDEKEQAHQRIIEAGQPEHADQGKPADHAKAADHAKPADHAEQTDRADPAPSEKTEKADKDQE
jgi:WD40 repeat protein